MLEDSVRFRRLDKDLRMGSYPEEGKSPEVMESSLRSPLLLLRSHTGTHQDALWLLSGMQKKLPYLILALIAFIILNLLLNANA